MLLGFKKRFKQPILDGTKKFTIRERRKIEPKIGETLYMYTGLRTSDCEKITDQYKLKSIQLVDIALIKREGVFLVEIGVDGRLLNDKEIESFVVADGFVDAHDFATYWFDSEKPKSKAITVIVKDDLVLHHWTDLRY